jgi:hypothetical protein
MLPASVQSDRQYMIPAAGVRVVHLFRMKVMVALLAVNVYGRQIEATSSREI